MKEKAWAEDTITRLDLAIAVGVLIVPHKHELINFCGPDVHQVKLMMVILMDIHKKYIYSFIS